MSTMVVYSRHSVLVAGFRAVVAEPAGFHVSACSEPEELPPFLDRPPQGASPPALVLIDVGSGITLDFLRGLRALAPDAGFILWVDAISPEFVRQAIGSGVLGVLRKDASTDLGIQCLSCVASGQLWLESEMSQRLLASKTVKLSPRERQLVSLLTQGLRNKEIAWRMNITEGTTKVYLSRLFQKTGASDRFELAVFVLKNIEIDPATGPSRGSPIFSFFEPQPA